MAVTVGAALDSRRCCQSLALGAGLVTAVVAGPAVAPLAVAFLTSQTCWANYQTWHPLVHAPLPLKLLVVRQLYVWAVLGFRRLENLVRAGLVEVETRALEAGVRESSAAALARDV